MSARLCRVFALLLAALFLFTACSGGSSGGSQARMEELGNEFSSELDENYIYIRESLPALLNQEAVVVTDRTYNLEYLYEFYESYKAGEDTHLVTVFQGSSFVVTKLMFEGGAGYYFRYEFNPLNESEIVITSEMVDSVETQGDPERNRVTLVVNRPKKSSIEISYKNIVDDAV